MVLANVKEAKHLLNQVLARDFPRSELFDHQHAALLARLAHGWESGQFSTLLAGDVGTGKTLFYLVFMRCVREWYVLQGDEETANLPSLIIAPAAIKKQLDDEALLFSVLNPLCYLVVGGKGQRLVTRLKILNDAPALIPTITGSKLEAFIMNYALVRRKAEQQQLQSMKFLVVIVDESHRIKSRGALQTVAIKSINCMAMVCGSGTQMTRHPDDLWSILHAMNPGPEFYRKAYITHPKPGPKCPYIEEDPYYHGVYSNRKTGCRQCYRFRTGNCSKHTEYDEGVPVRYRRRSPLWGAYETFTRRFCQTKTLHVGGGKWVNKIIGAKNVAELREKLMPIMVRWRASEVLDLPDIYISHVIVPFGGDGSQEYMYQQLKAGFINVLRGDGFWQPTTLRSRLAQLTHLRRSLALSPRAFYRHIAKRQAQGDSVPPWVMSALDMVGTSNAKIDWLIPWLEENVYNGDAQALVFSEWTTVTRELWARIGVARQQTTGYATGEGTKSHNYRVQRDFNEGLLDVVIGTAAISEGINLQGAGRGRAYVIILNCTWTPMRMIQVIGRLYRAGQRSDVEVIFLGVEDSFDQWMVEVVRDRQGTIQAILDGSADSGAVQLFEIGSARQLIDAL